MAKTMLAISLLMGAGACSSAPVQSVTPTTSTLPDPTTTTELPTTTTIVPVETTTTTEAPYDWGPVLCPSEDHPAHHEPCQGQGARSAPIEAYEAPEPAAPQSRTTRQGGGDGSGGTPPEYVKQCESGGDYGAVNPNGHYGAWQFSQSTWESVGGTGRPDHASPAEQDKRAAILYDGGNGASHWECA